MTFVVTEACIRCKYTDCVPECPVSAIYAEEDVPSNQLHFTALNAELSREWKPITRTRLPLPDAEEWSKIEAKLGELKR
jgi:ferredoxin